MCQVYKHTFVMIIDNREMCRLDYFHNDCDLVVYFPRVEQTNNKRAMPNFERDFFRYEFEVSDDWEIHDVRGLFCKFHFYVELLMHDNQKKVKSITKFHKLEEWTHLFQDYCFHNNKSNESDWTMQPSVIATSCFVENSLYSSTKKEFRTRGSQAQVTHAGLIRSQDLNNHFLTVSKSQHEKTAETIRSLEQTILDLELTNLQTDGYSNAAMNILSQQSQSKVAQLVSEKTVLQESLHTKQRQIRDLAKTIDENTLTIKQIESDVKSMDIHEGLQTAQLAKVESYITSIVSGVQMVSGEIQSACAQTNLELFKMTQVSNLASVELLIVATDSIVDEIRHLQTIFEEEHNDANVKQTMDHTATLQVQKNILISRMHDVELSIPAAPSAKPQATPPAHGKKWAPEPSIRRQAIQTQRDFETKFKLDTPSRARVRKVPIVTLQGSVNAPCGPPSPPPLPNGSAPPPPPPPPKGSALPMSNPLKGRDTAPRRLLASCLLREIKHQHICGSIFQGIEDSKTEYTISVDLQNEIRQLFGEKQAKGGKSVEEIAIPAIQTSLYGILCVNFAQHGQTGIDTCAFCSQARTNYLLYQSQKKTKYTKFEVYMGLPKREEEIKRRIKNLIDTSSLCRNSIVNTIDDESLKLTREDIEIVSEMLTEKTPGAEWQFCNSAEAAEILSNALFNERLYDQLKKMATIPAIGEKLHFTPEDLLPFKLKDITTNTYVKVEATWEWYKIDISQDQLRVIENTSLCEILTSTKVSTKQKIKNINLTVTPGKDCTKVGNDYYGVREGLKNDVYLNAIECTTYEKNVHTKADFYRAMSQAHGSGIKNRRLFDFMIYVLEQPDIVLLVKKAQVDFGMEEVLMKMEEDVQVLTQIVAAMQSARAEMQTILEIVLLMVNTLGASSVVAVDLLCLQDMRDKKTNDKTRNVTYYAALLYYNTFVSHQPPQSDILPESTKLKQLLSAHAMTLDFNALNQKMADIINVITRSKTSIEDKHPESSMITKMAEVRTTRIDPLLRLLGYTQSQFNKVFVCVCIRADNQHAAC